jgi:hypothetical protein
MPWFGLHAQLPVWLSLSASANQPHFEKINALRAKKSSTSHRVGEVRLAVQSERSHAQSRIPFLNSALQFDRHGHRVRYNFYPAGNIETMAQRLKELNPRLSACRLLRA